MDIYLFRALANGFQFRNAPSTSATNDLKGIVKSIALAVVGGSTGGNRGDFMSSDISLDDVNNAYRADSYVKQSIDKHSELMFKAGWKLHSKNENALEYLDTRFRLMAYTTGIPFEQLMAEVSEDLIKYSNAFLVKARQKKAMPTSGITINPATKAGQPIAGYFRINPRIMQAKIDDYGNIQQWKQTINNTEKAHKIDDIIHFYYKREAGEIFGMPYIWPALEDVRLLRQLEDNIAVLIYRYAVPIYHFIIGALQPGFEATPEEIDEAKAKINEMPTDGIIITNERTQIKSVGAEGQALDASNYLKYYENRVFTGLGVSQTQMGRGDTANKNTADAIDQQMVDRVKSFQKIMELNITYNVIVELLLEGGFDPINNPDDIVSFKFNEVNIDTQIKLENHIVYKFEHNATTFDEMRESLGLDEADEARLFTNMIGPMAVLDAQASIDAQAETNNLNKPENQNGTRQSPKTSPRREFKEAFSQNQHKQTYYTFMNDISDATDEKSISLIASSATNLIVRSIASGCLNDIQRAANDVKIEKSLPGDVIISYEKVLNIIETELKSDVYGLLMDVATKPGNRKAVFDTNAYRLDFAERYWTSKAYNIAKLEAYKQVGVTNIQILGADETDRVCYPQNGEMEVKLYTTKNIPPFHSGCKCYIKAKE